MEKKLVIFTLLLAIGLFQSGNADQFTSARRSAECENGDETTCLQGDVHIGEPCDKPEDCVGPEGSSECNDEKKCECKPGFIERGDQRKCLPVRNKLEEDCEEDIQCQTGNPGEFSVCANVLGTPEKKACKCNPDAVADSGNTTCYPKAANVEGACEIQEQCTIFDNCQCNVGIKTCECEKEFISSNNKGKCLPANVRVGGKCEEPQQCVSFAEGRSDCPTSNTNQICVCKPGFIERGDQRKCLPVRNKLEEDCEEDIQCQTGNPGEFSVCANVLGTPEKKACKCNPDAVADSGKTTCYLKASHVEDDCKIPEQCAIFNYCRCNTRSNKCECEKEYVASETKSECLPRVQLGNTCIESAQCIENADCLEEDETKICKCIDGYGHAENNFGKCYKLATQVGESCEEHPVVQCREVANSKCSADKKCECEEDSVPGQNKTRCLLRRNNLHEDCIENVQCQKDHSKCLEMVEGSRTCECESNKFVEYGGNCLEVLSEINMPCKEDIQCATGMNNSECVNSVCRCNSHAAYYNKNCYITAKLGQVCTQDEQCYVGSNLLTRCAAAQEGLKRCQCLPGLARQDNECLAQKVGDPCVNGSGCKLINGGVQCTSGKCACMEGYTSDIGGKLCSGAKNNIYSSVALVLGLFLYLLRVQS